MPRAPLLALAGLAALATWCVQWQAHADPSDLPASFGYNYGEIETTRSAAMAGAARALGNGTTAPFMNPATMAMAQLYHIEALGQWTPEAERQVYGGVIVDSTRRLSGSVALVGGFVDPDGADRSYLDLRVALAFLIAKPFSVGLTGHYLNLQQDGLGPLGFSRASGGLLDPEDPPLGRDAIVNTMSFDAGVNIQLHFGISGQNLSFPDNAFLPTVLGGGVGYGAEDFSVEVDGLADFNSWSAITGRVMAGGEYLIADRFPVRLGYRFDQGAMSHAVSSGVGYIDPRFSVEASVRRTLVGPSATMIFVGIAYFLESSGLISIEGQQ
jgi:opacity protein-like surface antigen